MNIQNYKSKLSDKTFMFFIGHYYHLGGAEVAAVILAKELKKNYNANIMFVAGSADGQVKNYIEDLGFQTFYFKFDYKSQPWKKIPSYLKLIRFIRKHQPDFLLPYIAGNNKMVLPIWKYTGAKYAWWMQQDEGRELYKTKFEKMTIKKASGIISNSMVGMDFLQDAYGLDKDKMVHYNNVIYVPNDLSIQPYWRPKLNISQKAIVVSMIANITYYKDHKTLFKAWPIVLKHFKAKEIEIHLLLAGQPKKVVIDELKIIGFDLNISDSVHFLGSTEKTNELMKEANLVVHSSLKEGCPNAVCEAMALENAVIATDIPGNAEAMTRTFEDFCLAEPENPKDLADKIIYLLENPEKRKEIEIFNKKRIVEYYNVQQMLEKISKSLETGLHN